MKPILTTLTAAAAMVGVGVSAPAPASAHPLVIAPLAAAAILGGTAVAGTAVGAAASHPAAVPVPVPAAPAGYYAGGPAYGAGPCYFTNARVNGIVRRVQVCD
jgi:hypothetical protein